MAKKYPFQIRPNEDMGGTRVKCRTCLESWNTFTPLAIMRWHKCPASNSTVIANALSPSRTCTACGEPMSTSPYVPLDDGTCGRPDCLLARYAEPDTYWPRLPNAVRDGWYISPQYRKCIIEGWINHFNIATSRLTTLRCGTCKHVARGD